MGTAEIIEEFSRILFHNNIITSKNDELQRVVQTQSLIYQLTNVYLLSPAT